jgi:predicted nucleic acid-binding protein
LKRPEHLLEIGLDLGDVDAFLDNIASICEPVFPHFSYRPSIRDPDDEMFVEVALNSAADALVTFNLKDYMPGNPAERIL